MKIYRTIATILIFLFTLSINVDAQRNYSQEADESFELQQYYDAIALYKKAYSKVKKNKAEKARIRFKTAECYRMINNTKQSEAWYKRTIKAKYPDPIIWLYYADALKANEKYEDAVIEYNTYKEKVPSDPRGEKGAESSILAQKWKDNPTRHKNKNERRFNSNLNDFCACYADKKFSSLVFTSSREGTLGKGHDAWTGQNFTSLFYAKKDRKGSWSVPVLLDEGIVNTDANEGSSCFNKRYNTVYFTRCNIEKKKRLGCKIYAAKKRGRNWAEPVEMILSDDSLSSVGHPFITNKELTIYFSSDIPGGYGGKDIWMAIRPRKTKPFGKPVNLGPAINTVGDEMFPFIREDGTLYFASNGHIGMGGLDIFKSKKVGSAWSTPVNMKYPVNSAGDDYAIIFEGKKNKGYFTSNRKGGRGGDDIWSFYIPPLIFTLQGVVKDDSTKKIIVGARIKLVGSDGTIIYDSTDATGAYIFDKEQILPNTTYELTFSKTRYFTKKGKETTVGLEQSKNLVHNANLPPIPKKAIELPEILYDLAKWDLKPQYTSSLDGLIQTMEDNPKIVIELGSHTDSRPIPMTNAVLSQKRAKSVVDYLISRDIAPGRLVAKGYGARVPKVLTKDIVKNGVKIKKGTVLTDEFIKSLKTRKDKEVAHQLNRRTEFKVLGEDYVPVQQEEGVEEVEIEMIEDENEDNEIYDDSYDDSYDE